MFDRNTKGRPRKYRDAETQIDHKRKVHRDRITQVSRFLEACNITLFKADIRQGFALFYAVYDIAVHCYAASPESILCVREMVEDAGIDIGKINIVSLIRSVITDPASLFPERQITFGKDEDRYFNTWAEAKKFQGIMSEARKLNKARFVDNDWSNGTLAEMINAYCIRVHGVNSYTVARRIRQGGVVPLLVGSVDEAIDEVYASIMCKNWSGKVYHRGIAGKFRVRCGVELGPGSQLFKRNSYSPIMAEDPNVKIDGMIDLAALEQIRRMDAMPFTLEPETSPVRAAA
ncbi:hypothetical protein [Paracoccus sp. J39]|uniref:hypothetical protein n=1 Tax=Paracoccus sp. J39 TaxID=935848 RepID=UPI0012EC498F|nr:hypothetical protein [Paracoccus sp. J39]